MTEKTKEELAAEKEAAATKKAQDKADAKAKKEAEKASKVQAKADAKAKKEADKAAAKLAAKQPEQHGITRPKPDTITGKAWAIFDKLSADTGAPATIADSLKAAKGVIAADATVRTQYARWRKYHGVTGRVAKEGAAE